MRFFKAINVSFSFSSPYDSEILVDWDQELVFIKKQCCCKQKVWKTYEKSKMLKTFYVSSLLLFQKTPLFMELKAYIS